MSSAREPDAAAGGGTGGGDLPRRRDGGVPHRCDVVVLGASFAGVEVLYQLRRRLARPLSILVVDRQERHGYIPLVHERLCGRVPMETTALDTAAFVRSLPGARLVKDEVVGLDPKAKRVELRSGQRIEARFVVVALGSELAPPPGLPGGEHLLRYKFGDELEHARKRLLELDERGDGGEAKPRVVVVGGGISGVELAAELAYTGRGRRAVSLVSASERLLPELATGVGRAAEAVLRGQGVDVRLRTRVMAVEPDAVRLRATGPDGEGVVMRAAEERLPCAAGLWAGGIRPAPVLEHLGLPRTAAGWLAVGPTLQCFPTAVPSQPDVFACGDAVRVVGGTGQWPTMQRAIECLWQAKVVATSLVTLAGQEAGYPKGVPPLPPHVLRPWFPYGVSLGGRSLVVVDRLRVWAPGVTVWFRRWLMRQYFARYGVEG
jgi:NADH:ubiquinone reductase (H+-translocating)